MSPREETDQVVFQHYLRSEFGTESDNYATIVPHLVRRLDQAPESGPIRASFMLWQESIDVNIAKIESDVRETVDELDLSGESGPRTEEFLYALQSYYAIVLHLDRTVNVARALDRSDPDDIEYRELRAQFPNLLDEPEDRLFQGWLADIDFTRQPFDQLLSSMAGAPSRDAGEDAFKDLYQDVIGNPFRKALGEFYTRGWVADLILTEIEYDGGSVLDPACGSGAFLVKSAREALVDDPEDIQRIHGFDLNPVAVIAAKSNLVGVLTSHFEDGLSAEELGRIDLPVYWTNSIVWSEPNLFGNTITLLSPYTEFDVPNDPEAAVEKISEELRDWIADREFERILDDTWVRAVAESFAAPVTTPPFDYVVGNPPWVSPDRMSKEYRDRVTALLEESGFLEPFQPDYLTNRFPNEQFVAALPFFEVTMDRYLGEDGTCAYLVTSSLLKSMNAGGFREQLQDWHVSRILDFTPYTDVHQNASSWAFVPVIDTAPRNGESAFYEYFTPTDGEIPSHPGDCRTVDTPDVDLHVCSWEVGTEEMPFIRADPRSPWFTAPPEIIDVYRRMISGGSHVGEEYRFTRGLVTGRNSVYLLDSVETEGRYVSCETNAADGRIRLESDLVYPFVEGKHLTAWDFDYTYLLVPYTVPQWDPIAEDVMQADYPKASEYLWSRKDELEGRRTHSIMTQMDTGKPFYVVESRDILGRTPVVAIREVAPYLEAAVIPPTIDDSLLGTRESVVAHTLNFVIPESEDEAYYLAGLLNAWPLRTMSYDLARPKGGRPGKRFDMYLVASLPLPRFEPNNGVHREISRLSREAHGAVEPARIEKIERELEDVVCEDIFDISLQEGTLLGQHYDRLSYTPD